MKISPKEFVELLEDKVIGQDEAKRTLAVALRNRWRRFQLNSNIRKTITPKNVLMIGPTGVGKTAIIRAMADLVDAPMVKVEATRYTQVGYHGEDVKNIITDLVEVARNKLMQNRKDYENGVTAFNFQYNVKNAETFLQEVKVIMQSITKRDIRNFKDIFSINQMDRFQSRVMALDKRVGEITNYNHLAMLMLNDRIIPEEFSMPSTFNSKKVALRTDFIFLRDRNDDLFNCEEKQSSLFDTTVREYVENMGIVFIDEIDKLAVKNSETSHDNVGKAGVQRDLLAILDGTEITTSEGKINTENIMFIAAGAFHTTKVSDLMPELLGRMPIRVNLDPMNKDMMERILSDTINSPVKQYIHLLKADGVKVKVRLPAIKEIARVAAEINTKCYSMGARTLHAVVEKVFSTIAFDAFNEKEGAEFIIDKEYVSNITDTLIERYKLDSSNEK